MEYNYFITFIKVRNILIIASLLGVTSGCVRKYKCTDMPIVAVFPSKDSTDIDTLIIKKYTASGDYQHLLDTFRIVKNISANYEVTDDSIMIYITDDKQRIKAGYDWQLFIPAKNRMIKISDIKSEKATGKCGTVGEPLGCFCFNTIYSLRINDRLIIPSKTPQTPYLIYLK